MSTRLSLLWVIGAVLLCASVGTAQQAPPLRDYRAAGEFVVRVEIDAAPAERAVFDAPAPVVEKERTTFAIPMVQAFVAPDRYYLEWNPVGLAQVLVFQGGTEYNWSPTSGFLLQTRFQNVNRPNVAHPSMAFTMSLEQLRAALGAIRPQRSVPAAEAMPARDVLEARRDELKLKYAEITERRKQGVSAEVAPQLARESARLGEDLAETVAALNFLELQRAYPCDARDYENRQVLAALSRLTPAGPAATALLAQGSTRIWFTRDGALPVRVELKDQQERPTLQITFTDLKLNTGLSPDRLVTGAPEGVPIIRVNSDLANRNWEYQREDAVKKQIAVLRQQGFVGEGVVGGAAPGDKRGTTRPKIKRD